MGFQRKRKIYKLDFDGTEYEGLRVSLTGLTTGEYLDIISLSDASEDETAEEGRTATFQMLRTFAQHLVAWNLTDEDDVPIPTTFDSVKDNDLTMNMSIISAWTAAIGGVDDESGKKSSTGSDSEVASIPTETL